MDELARMAVIMRHVQLAIGGLRLTERQQARVLYYVVEALHKAFRPEVTQWQ